MITMTDAQYLFDLAAKQYNDVADSIENHFETVAVQIREWLPQTAKPPPPPPRRLPLASTSQSIQRWISHNRALSAGIVAFVSTGALYVFIQTSNQYKRRKAKRSKNGARTEVVVLAGSPTSPITTSLALDLERRGFIVYVITSTPEEEQYVRNHSRVDVLPLTLDLLYPDAAQDQIGRFHHLLSRHHHAIEGAPAHVLRLKGIILIPQTQSAIGSVSDLSPSVWSTALNAKVLNTIVTIQHLLPLVTDFHSRILLLTPSVITSLRPSQHAIESTVCSALEAFAASLASELRPQGLHLCHFKLGNLDLPGSKTRDEYGVRKVKGSPMRKLHESVFDALQAQRPSQTWHVGKGSLVYDVIGGWLPGGVVGWMMGLRKPSLQAIEYTPDTSDEGSESSVQWEKVEQMV